MADKPQKSFLSKKSTQLAGLILWRFGLALAGATALYRTSKLLLQFIDLPLQLEIGIGLIFSGAVLFLASMIIERIADLRQEGDLTR